MRTTVIRVSRQSPRLLLALRPSELDALVRALQAARRDPDQSVYLSVAGEQGQPLTEVEIYLDETDRGATLVARVADSWPLGEVRESATI